MKVAIIGAGLAGTACAYVLKLQGIESEIYEAGSRIALGASGNAIGLYNPRLSAERSFYMDAFELALKTFPTLDVDWAMCGALHVMTDEMKEKRFTQALRHFKEAEIVDAGRTSEIAGVDLKYEALWLPQSGTVSPQKLCEAYARGIPVHFNQIIESLPEADIVILANGFGVKKFIDLPLGQVRGQITFVKETPVSKKLNCAVCYGGYMSPALDGVHAVGATFQRWLNHSDIIEQDDADNLAKLKMITELQGFEVVGHRAGVRTTTKDHFPIIGHVQDNIYVSTGHGSHGILSSLAGAHVLAAQITGSPAPFNTESLQPGRFLV